MTLTEHGFTTSATGAVDNEGFDDREVDVLFDRLVVSLRLLGDRELIQRADRFEQRLERERLTAAARVAGSSGNVTSDRKRTRSLLGGPGRSRRSVNRDARRAAAVAANPALQTKVASGSIAADSLDPLTKAADPDTGSGTRSKPPPTPPTRPTAVETAPPVTTTAGTTGCSMPPSGSSTAQPLAGRNRCPVPNRP